MSSSSIIANFTNLSKVHLIEHAIKSGEGFLSELGALITNTKKYTGRSPNDKFTVVDESTKDNVWFSSINKPMLPEHAQAIYEKVIKYLSVRPCYVLDCQAGASLPHSLKLKVTTERAWHSLFAHTMFLPIDKSKLDASPDFQVFHAPGFLAQKDLDHTNSEAAVIIDYTKKRIVICGTEYAGEIKKSVFSVLNYMLPFKGILGMHCAANQGPNGDSAIFFGLSGTGKTTLSADSSRALIGDDEHGWDDDGIFNFEGGCYAKVIRLSNIDEPEIFFASQQFGSILENVSFDEKTRKLDLNSSKYSENTRSSYDISLIKNASKSRLAPHPKHIFMLTCDAFGVLPPIAKLDANLAAYHFINGYTAKVAGTERGIIEPQAVFSPCFGAPFMSQDPKIYAKILLEKINKHQVQCWLVNTGWTGGPYGIGSRMKISWTRALLHAALSGELDQAKYALDPIFKFLVPTEVSHVPKEILWPKNTWTDQSAYITKAEHLAELFDENYKPYLET